MPAIVGRDRVAGGDDCGRAAAITPVVSVASRRRRPGRSRSRRGAACGPRRRASARSWRRSRPRSSAQFAPRGVAALPLVGERERAGAGPVPWSAASSRVTLGAGDRRAVAFGGRGRARRRRSAPTRRVAAPPALVAVTTTRSVLPASAGVAVYVVPVAPAMSAQSPPAASQRCQLVGERDRRRAGPRAGRRRSASRRRARVPETAGRPVLTGARATTPAVAAVALASPAGVRARSRRRGSCRRRRPPSACRSRPSRRGCRGSAARRRRSAATGR